MKRGRRSLRFSLRPRHPEAKAETVFESGSELGEKAVAP